MEVLSEARPVGADDAPDDGSDATTAPGGDQAVSSASPEADAEREVVMPVGANLNLAEEAAKEAAGTGERDKTGEADAYDIDALIDGALQAGPDADLREAGSSAAKSGQR